MKHYLKKKLYLLFLVSLYFTSQAHSKQSALFSFITCPNDTIVSEKANCNAVVVYTPTLNGIPPPFVIYAFTGATIGNGIGTGSGSTFNLGITTVTLIAGDASGTDTCSFTITVLDITPPTILCPPTTTLNVDNLCQAVLGNYTLGATVNLSLTVNSGSSGTACTDPFLQGAPDPQWALRVNGQAYTNYPQMGLCYTNPPFLQFTQQYNLGNYPATVQVCFNPYEDDGNGCVPVKSCSVQVCQNYATPAPGNSLTYTLTIPNNGQNASWGTVTFTLQASAAIPIASDNCGPVTITQSPPPGTILGVGTQAVTLIASDPSGNTTPCTFQVNVVDVTPPVITCPANVTINNNCQHVLADYTVSNAVNLNLTVTSGNSGTNCTDGFLQGAPEPQWAVRVNGLSYINYPQNGICYNNPPFLQFSQQYSIGNYPASVQVCFNPYEDDGTNCIPVKSCSTQVCQNFNTPAPGNSINYSLSIPNNGQNASWGNVNFALQASFNGAQASDNCGIASITQVPAPGTILGVGSHPITLTATDLSGNTASCTFQINVVSNQSPPTQITGTTSICIGGATTLTVTGGNPGTGGSTQWFSGSCGGTLLGTGNSISVSPLVTTTYFVRYTGPCGTTVCISVTVNVNPTPGPPVPLIIANGPIFLCRGGSVTLTSSPGTSILWSTLETTQSILVTQPGTYRVSDTDLNGCTAFSDTINVTFNSGNISPFSPQLGIPYEYGFENASPPALFCGMSINNDNYPPDDEQWETATNAPHSGNNHMAIQANSNSAIAKNDWFYSAPLHLQAGKLYRLSFWYMSSNPNTSEQFQVYAGNTTNSFDMLATAPIYSKSNITNQLYVKDSATDFIAPLSGIYYFGFYAHSAAAQGNLYIDDISVKEVTVTQLQTSSCSTLNSLNDVIYATPVYGASNYRYKLVNSASSFNYEFTRNLALNDFRLKWAPGVIYGNNYDVSVAFQRNGVWSEYGASCTVSLGAFPQTQLRVGSCGSSITSLYTPLFCDSISGANDYEYRIENSLLGYDHTWQRGSSLNDYKLSWAYSSTPPVQGLPYGYSYNIQVRALVGKTALQQGEWGTFGPACSVTLSGMPTTQLSNLFCGSTLTNLTSKFYCIPVPGATDYEYRISNTALGYSQSGTRGNSLTDYQLNWLPSASGGIRYATTYDVEVRAKVGGVWGLFGSVCQLSVSAAPLTSLQTAYCNYLLPSFTTQVFITAVAGASNYRYHISNASGYDKTFLRNSGANDWRFSWTQLCCNQLNMQPNTTYDVEVASYAGGVWSAYGPVCQITTGASVPRLAAYSFEDYFDNQSPTNNVTIYPNPVVAAQPFTIEIDGALSEVISLQYSIYNTFGQKVYSNNLSIEHEKGILIQPEVQLSSGVYILEATIDGEFYRMKFIVQ
ncbi:MAG: HYR domain-containing protein [Bacteroidia bacterium]|nr:HYR domain-containing protein [Bacteroidia bacterium]